MGTLYVVGTPIGNLEDITLRAVRVLTEAAFIVAEDTRVTRKLLAHYNIHTPLLSYNQHSRGEQADSIVKRLADGSDAALVSDAGMPAISDPGFDLVKRAAEAGIRVVPVPGPSAALAALVASALPTARFVFEGFPPRGSADRRAFFYGLAQEQRTIILYESPARLISTLQDMLTVMADRDLAIGRELTKLHEELYRGTISGAIATFTSRRPRGEFTLVVRGAEPGSARSDDGSKIAVRLRSLLRDGLSARDAVARTAGESGMPHKQVYRMCLQVLGELPAAAEANDNTKSVPRKRRAAGTGMEDSK